MAHRPTRPDQMAEHVMLGPSNEDLIAKQKALDEQREADGYPRVEFSRDAEDKQIFEKRNDLEFDPYAERNPMESAVEANRQPGMSYKFLSERVNNFLGVRGYEIVKNGGDPVKVGNMVLGKIPTHVAESRQRRYQKDAEDDLTSIQRTYESQVEDAAKTAESLGLRVLRNGEGFSGHTGTVNGPGSGGASASGSAGVEFTSSRRL